MSHLTPGAPGHITPDGPIPKAHRHAGGGHWTPAEQRAAFDRAHPSLTSRFQTRGRVTFPPYRDERIYMEPVLIRDGEALLPSRLRHWAATVETMMKGIEPPGVCYLMVDQSVAKAGGTQRRPGPHIDGQWSPKGGGAVDPQDWYDNELVVLAFDKGECVAYEGSYPRTDFKRGGDCSAMDLSALKRVTLKAGRVHVLTVATIHESVPVTRDTKRTLVRINVPGVTL